MRDQAFTFAELVTLEGAVALAAASGAIPVFVYLRWGRAPGRIAAVLWPWITLGAFLVGAPLFRIARGARHPDVAAVGVLGLYALMLLHLSMLALPRMRSALTRWAVVLPGTVLTCTCLIAHPFTALAAIGRALTGGAHSLATDAALTSLEVAPFALSLLAIWPSMRPRVDTVAVAAGDAVSAERPRRPRRVSFSRVRGKAPRPAGTLRIAQLTDMHLGGLVSVRALHDLVKRLLARDPDLVLLTGDYLALEGMFTHGALAEALAPLRALQGRCFAALGNHDLDALPEVRNALHENGVRLLVDESALVTTPVGVIEVLGVDHREADRRAHLRRVVAAPRAREARLRIVLLHDPGRFAHLDPRHPDLHLGGHLHGGQVGLLSLGATWTILTPTGLPDHGYFGFGAARLWAHRGTGTFGFPLRIGVPAEESVLDVELAPSRAAVAEVAGDGVTQVRAHPKSPGL